MKKENYVSKSMKLAGTVAVLGLAGSAHAQTVEKTQDIETVVVTAQKREQLLQDVLLY